MKTTILKILSVATVATATTFAVKGKTEQKGSLLVNVPGYRIVNGTCTILDVCSQTGNQICTVGDVNGAPQLFGKNALNQCVIVLYRPDVSRR